MKTKLPKRSLVIQERLDNITKEALIAAKDKICMIILFGSYARGDWVRDQYVKGHITYYYQSDIDILVLVKGKYGGGPIRFRIKDSIQRRLERKGLRNSMTKKPKKILTDPTEMRQAIWEMMKVPPVTIILEPITRVNKCLEEGQYFFSDIKKEGVVLYDSGEFQLSEAKDLPWIERREIAQRDYDYWFKLGAGFFIGSKYYLEIGEYGLSAFSLHQATESFYSAILLVFSGDRPKLHDIRKLGSMVGNYNDELWSIFPHSEGEQEESFKLLQEAYIKGRYDPDYKISKEQLLYLIERVEKLKTVTEKMCLARLAQEIISKESQL